MNKSAFLKLIQQASNISDQQTEELEKMAVAFPYCQTAHLLLAKSAYDKGSMLSAQRLRRAASYATNRQILKRVLYTTPAAPVFGTVQEEEQIEVPVTAPPLTEAMVQAAPEAEDRTYAADELPSNLENSDVSYTTENLVEDTWEEAQVVDEPVEDILVEDIPAEAEAPYDSSESELISLLTINSLSASFTDLLAQEPDPEPEEVTDKPADEVSVEALENSTINYIYTSVTEPEEGLQENSVSATVSLPTEAYHDSVVEDEQLPEEAPITYASDEIDRLYAEDALGYWMGSSRMGEQLQLKDEYTRPKPYSFHPELILEYNKTHELEKAIQPAANVLSQQLDIIEQFLKLNPRLKTMANLKIKEQPQEDLSLKSSKIKKNMASENLANIFIKQGKVKKAIKIYEQLILKNPEKKTYFAEQIEKLQNQI